MISVSENFLVNQSVFSQNKKCPFLTQGICIYVGHSFLWNSWTNSFNVFQLRVGNTSVEGKEVKCFNAIAGGEGPRLYVL